MHFVINENWWTLGVLKISQTEFNPVLSQVLTKPWVDRTFAVIFGTLWLASAVWGLIFRPFSPELMAHSVSLLVTSMTIYSRRAPSRVSTNGWVWFFVFSVNLAEALAALYAPPGDRIAPRFLTLPITCLCSGFVIAARLNLGRNIGLVPARREIVSTGLYAYIRHPIYLAMIVSLGSALLSRFSVWLFCVFLFSIAAKSMKAILEEQFLAEAPDYREYLQRVRWRMIPYIF